MAVHTSHDLHEELLQAWIDMSLMIRGNRLLSDFSFNEIVICRILYAQRQNGGDPVTATQLCSCMQLLKSQVNKILTAMEKAGTIERVRSETDKRKIEIRLCESAVAAYEREHERILRLMAYIGSRLGDEQCARLAHLLEEAVASIQELPAPNEKGTSQ